MPLKKVDEATNCNTNQQPQKILGPNQTTNKKAKEKETSDGLIHHTANM